MWSEDPLVPEQLMASLKGTHLWAFRQEAPGCAWGGD